MASAVDGAGGRALEAVAAAAVEDQMVRSPAASNLPMSPAASAGLAGEGVGAAVAEVIRLRALITQHVHEVAPTPLLAPLLLVLLLLPL